MKATYNKREIMEVAHSIYRTEKRYGVSFSYCLKLAWKEAKKDVARKTWDVENGRTWTNNYNYKHTGMNNLYANRAYAGD